MRRESVYKAVRAAALLVCLICVMAAAVSIALPELDETAYRNLATHTVDDGSLTSQDVSDADDGKDETVSPATIAWLIVEGTHISYPVVEVDSDLPRTWYLNHDLWGEPNELGCPYLDERSNPHCRNLLVYGHHFQGTTLMFSDLADAYKPERFNAIGTATWMGVDEESTEYIPLAARRVDENFKSIQRFSFSDKDDLILWLLDFTTDADARSDDWVNLIATCTHALALVTCSDEQAGGTERTIVLFVADKGDD